MQHSPPEHIPSEESPAQSKGRRNSLLLAWMAQIIALLLMFWGATISRSSVEHDRARRFDSLTEVVERAINDRMASYEALLRGGHSLIVTGKNIGRDDWRQYLVS